MHMTVIVQEVHQSLKIGKVEIRQQIGIRKAEAAVQKRKKMIGSLKIENLGTEIEIEVKKEEIEILEVVEIRQNLVMN